MGGRLIGRVSRFFWTRGGRFAFEISGDLARERFL